MASLPLTYREDKGYVPCLTKQNDNLPNHVKGQVKWKDYKESDNNGYYLDYKDTKGEIMHYKVEFINHQWHILMS